MTTTAVTNRTNSILALAVVAVLLVYVIQANVVASSGWRIRQAEQSLADAHVARDTLATQEASLEDGSFLLASARTAGMVPAGDIVYLVQPQPVAVR